MNWPTKKLEELVLGGRLAHGGHPVLRWMAGNVSIETDAADNWKTTKKYSPERIDGIVALVMALDRASREVERWVSAHLQSGRASVIERRSVVVALARDTFGS